MTPTTEAAANGGRQRRAADRARERGLGKAAWLIGALVLAVFGGLAWWLSTQEPPNVTHAEAMRMAVAIEQAKSAAQLEPLFALEWPSNDAPDGAEPQPDVFTPIARFLRNSSYTFVHVGMDDRGERSLLFRVHSGTYLHDYQVLRLARRAGRVVVTDFQTIFFGLDGFAMRTMRAWPAETRLCAAEFVARLRRDDVATLRAEFERLPEAVRSLPWVGVSLLQTVAERRPEDLLQVLGDVRAVIPDNLGVDIVLLQQRAIPWGPLQEAARAAIERLKARVGDPQFLEQVWERVTR